MSEISNAFENDFIILLMKSDSRFLNKRDSCISTNSNVRGPKVVTLTHLSDCPGLETLTGKEKTLADGSLIIQLVDKLKKMV